MEIVDRIPASLNPEEVGRRLHFQQGRAGFDGVEGLLGLAMPLIRLRAVYESAFIGEKGEAEVEISGVVFRSHVLRRNLDLTRKVFPYVMTAGGELEAKAVSSGDLLKQYYLEEIANLALEAGLSWLSRRLAERWGFPILSGMSPGSLEDWPITEQPRLFSLLGDTERTIGVRLTESLLMVPRKSVSGILFPSEETFYSCRLCERQVCPSRKAAYDPAMAAEYQANPELPRR